MKLMDFLNKSIEVLEKQIKHGVNFQNLVSRENLALKHGISTIKNF